ncbi:LolA family protein [Zunongwangia sp.]|uniref:LolA family protein n=1 Tax=Zunongwangia sp. TaxID=1965325 RepID=UPI003AA961F5
MRIINFLFFFCSLSLLAQQPSNFAKLEKHTEPAELTVKMAEAKSLHSEFRQIKVIAMMDSESESKGEIFYESPDLIKWVYNKPFSYSLLFKNDHLYINDDGQKSEQDLSGNKMFAKLGDLITGSLNGELLKDDENFTITYSHVKNGTNAVMIPKNENLASIFQKVVMCFSKENTLQSVKLVEESGDYTMIQFKEWHFNKPIDKSVFQQ